MSDFLKLNNIAERNGDIKCATLNNNLISARIGSNGFGEVVIAVDNDSVIKIIKGEVKGALYITSNEEWKKEADK